MNVKEILREAKRRLRESGSSSPDLDGEVLLGWCLGCERTALFSHPERRLDPVEMRNFHDALDRRERGEPVAYITGKKEFWSFSLVVTKDVLIPRPDTETVVEAALECMYGRKGLVLDVGTGSGAIAIALAVEMPENRVVAVDYNEAALRLASFNAKTNGVAEKIFFICADLFPPPGKKFAMIVSNPPYIDEATFAMLPGTVREYEPKGALVAGPLGTEYHQRLIEGAVSRLEDEGWLVMEIGDGQRDEVERIFRESRQYDQICCRKDLAGLDRVVAGRKGTVSLDGQDRY